MVQLGQHIVGTVKSGFSKKIKDSFVANKKQIHIMIICMSFLTEEHLGQVRTAGFPVE